MEVYIHEVFADEYLFSVYIFVFCILLHTLLACEARGLPTRKTHTHTHTGFDSSPADNCAVFEVPAIIQVNKLN